MKEKKFSTLEKAKISIFTGCVVGSLFTTIVLWVAAFWIIISGDAAKYIETFLFMGFIFAAPALVTGIASTILLNKVNKEIENESTDFS